MERKIINIDEKLCNGCGACANACHEGAIAMVNGKAKLMRDDYCDGLGDCLPACPTGAISFVIREAAAYDEEAVMENKKNMTKIKSCPGTAAKNLKETRSEFNIPLSSFSKDAEECVTSSCPGTKSQSLNNNTFAKCFERRESCLAQWPVQIKLAPVKAPYFDGAKLLIAADCTAYAYASFHEDFMRGHVTLIGCPKLDNTDYSEKLGEIIKKNDIKSVIIVRMEVPCCGGLENAAKKALQKSGKFIPWQVVTISLHGEIIDK